MAHWNAWMLVATSSLERAVQIAKAPTSVVFRDVSGAELATASYACAVGTMHIVDGDRDAFITVRPEPIATVMAEPLLPADVLFGVDRIEIKRPQVPNAVVELTSRDEIDALLGAVVLDAIEPPPMTRCLPSYVVSFRRGADQIAWSTFDCASGSAMPETTIASFSAPDRANADALLVEGGITLHPAPIVAAWDARQ